MRTSTICLYLIYYLISPEIHYPTNFVQTFKHIFPGQLNSMIKQMATASAVEVVLCCCGGYIPRRGLGFFKITSRVHENYTVKAAYQFPVLCFRRKSFST